MSLAGAILHPMCYIRLKDERDLQFRRPLAVEGGHPIRVHANRPSPVRHHKKARVLPPTISPRLLSTVDLTDVHSKVDLDTPLLQLAKGPSTPSLSSWVSD
jgi:hypothetical protein